MWVNPKWIINSPKVPLVLLTADEREKHIIFPCWYGVVSHTVLETRRRAFKHLCSHMVGEQDHAYTLVSVCVEHVCWNVHHQVCNCKISLLALLCWFISLFRGVHSLVLPKGLSYFLLSSALLWPHEGLFKWLHWRVKWRSPHCVVECRGIVSSIVKMMITS